MTDESEQLRAAVRAFLSAPTPSQLDLERQHLEEFTTFYNDFTPKLIGFLVLQGARPADAAEITQSTMIKAWQSWSTIDSPKAWARTVASRDWVRRVADTEEDLIAEPERSALLSSSSDIDEWIQRDEYYQAMRALPSRQRQIMAWTMEGHTPAEIADQLRLNPASVRSSLRKARRTLAAILEKGAQQ
jgi:RNA polymerase sigma-70 factor (ECF subfamily)